MFRILRTGWTKGGRVGSKRGRRQGAEYVVRGMKRPSSVLPFVTGKHETSADGGSAQGAMGMWEEKQARKFVKFQYVLSSFSASLRGGERESRPSVYSCICEWRRARGRNANSRRTGIPAPSPIAPARPSTSPGTAPSRTGSPPAPRR